MKLSLTSILTIIAAVVLVAFGFAWYQSQVEKNKLKGEIRTRTSMVSEAIFQNNRMFLKKPNKGIIENFADSVSKQYNLLGIAYYINDDSIFSNNNAKKYLKDSHSYITISIAADTSIGNFFKFDNKRIYRFIIPVKRKNLPGNAVIFYSDASYIRKITGTILFSNFFGWFIQALLVSVITILLLRWGIFSQIKKIVDWAKAVRTGNGEELKPETHLDILDPLHKEIEYMAKEMNEAKAIAEEEARLRSSAEAIWTPERLRVEIEILLKNRKLIVVSNREPYMHIHTGKEIKCIVPASGLITAMEPVLKASGGLWIAAGTGDADKETVDKDDKVQVPPDEPKYTLRRLWLSKEEETHYYYGFSNEGLWPLCHIAHTRPIFRNDDWLYYKKVNEDFANAVLEEIEDEDDPFILIQDFHFALLPELIKLRKPHAKVAIFWHIPWPNPESFGICPWQREILQGMLGADLIGFHTQYHCNHFLETVNNAIEARVLWEDFSVKKAGRTTYVKPFPISIAFTLKDYGVENRKTDVPKLLESYGIKSTLAGIGVDRIDYTKGIVEKFLAVERFFEKNPDYIGKFTFIQIGAPSKTLLKTYSDTVKAVEEESERVNARFKLRNWKAILLLKRHHSHEEILPFYSSADFCMVTSLHDGMNLVAKEFVASRTRNDGSLILSRFAGASQELQGAIIINPYDIEKSADAIKTALEMSSDEQAQRMMQMRLMIVRNNIYSWAASLLRTMESITP